MGWRGQVSGGDILVSVKKGPKRIMQGGSNSGEDALLRKISRGLGAGSQIHSSLKLGIGDDAALWRAQPGYEVILTCDWFLEDVHFWRNVHPADSVGWKCLARAVSDVAAMGGEPRCFLLNLALPLTHTGRWLDEFLTGLRRAGQALNCVAAGGDTTRHEKILICVTVIGEVKKGRAVPRSGARSGDLICVSGWLGEAQFGLELLTGETSPPNKNDKNLRKHLYPAPRLELSQRLAERGIATAMMDLSDGLSSDLPRLCAASHVGARVYESKLPLARGDGRQPLKHANLLSAALHGGDDYELLFTVPKRKARQLGNRFAGAPVTIIGEIQSGSRILLVQEDGKEKPLEAAGWDPFRRKSNR